MKPLRQKGVLIGSPKGVTPNVNVLLDENCLRTLVGTPSVGEV